MGEKVKSFIVGLLLYVLAFVVLNFLPKRVGMLTWVLILISALTFMFGYFYMGSAFDGPSSRGFRLGKKILFIGMGIAMIIYSVYALVINNYDGKGLGKFTMLLIYGLAMFYYGSAKGFDYAVDGIKQSELVETPIEQLQRAFADVETPMGKPWLGKVLNIDSDCLIYGPTKSGAFLYAYYLFGTFTVAESQVLSQLVDEHASEHVIEGDWDRDDVKMGQLYHLLARMMPDFYIGMFDEFQQTGVAECRFKKLFYDKKPNVFIFDELFAIVHQKYRLLDLEGNAKYKMQGVFPFWTFRMEDAESGVEVVKSKRIIWHIFFPTYDLYINGEKYGRMRWLFRILRTKFRMQTRDGEIMVREMTATIGDQYGVYKNGVLIGTISQKIGLSGLGTFVRDMVFDNFVVMVFDEADLPLVSSLSVMLGSFKNHGIKKS
ncbi:MAG: hypothetical protein K6G23_11030 [Lachnospiraceae bacterium]|nr:hypothetical protein [Lachnospiraceae bacterium]